MAALCISTFRIANNSKPHCSSQFEEIYTTFDTLKKKITILKIQSKIDAYTSIFCVFKLYSFLKS